MESQISNYEAIRFFIHSFSNGKSKQQLLDDSVTMIQRVSGCKFVGIRVLDENGYIPYESYVGFSRAFWESENMIQISKEDCSCTRLVSGQLLPFDKAIINKAGSLYCSDTLCFAQTLSAAEQKMYRGACNNAGYRSVAVIPIRHLNQILGVIHLADFKPDQIDQAALAFVEDVSPLIGEVLARDKIEKEVAKRQAAQAMLQKFRLFFIHSRDIMLFVDNKSGAIIEANPAAEEAYGYSREEILSRSIFDLRIDRETGLTIQQMNAAQDGIMFSTVHRRKDGSIFPVQVNSRCEQIGDSRILFSVVRDITLQQTFEAALRQLNMELEAKVAERTRELQDINAALEEEISERQAAEERQKKAEEELRFWAVELEQKVLERTRELQNINAALEEEVMERQTVQEELQESRERYQALVKQSSEAIAVISLNGGIIEINHAFIRLFGYSAEEVEGKNITEFNLLSPAEIETFTAESIGNNANRVIRPYSRKDGKVLYAERMGALIYHRGNRFVLMSYRDITEQQKLQAEINKQVGLAATVQKSLLLPDYQNKQLTIRTIFEPLTIVSGDFYGYRWSDDHSKVLGYLMDVTGHGVATALHTSAVSSLLNEAMESEQGWTPEILSRLNNYLYDYFQDSSFVAFIGFSLDYAAKQLTCVSGGINYLMVSTKEQCGVLTIPGSYLGVSKKPEFNKVTLPIQHGDAFYFMTDGIYDMLPEELRDTAYRFEDTVQALTHLAAGLKRDDCTALCLEVTGLNHFPLFFKLTGEYHNNIRSHINWILRQLIPEEQPKIGLALGEAITNAIEHGNNVRVKINLIGAKLVLRVKSDGRGFAGNEKIKAVLATGLEQAFQLALDNERGRGIPIMLHYADWILYNRCGNEVLLVKHISDRKAV